MHYTLYNSCPTYETGSHYYYKLYLFDLPNLKLIFFGSRGLVSSLQMLCIFLFLFFQVLFITSFTNTTQITETLYLEYLNKLR